jgi:hypothetical protein
MIKISKKTYAAAAFISLAFGFYSGFFKYLHSIHRQFRFISYGFNRKTVNIFAIHLFRNNYFIYRPISLYGFCFCVNLLQSWGISFRKMHFILHNFRNSQGKLFLFDNVVCNIFCICTILFNPCYPIQTNEPQSIVGQT